MPFLFLLNLTKDIIDLLDPVRHCLTLHKPLFAGPVWPKLLHICGIGIPNKHIADCLHHSSRLLHALLILVGDLGMSGSEVTR